MNSTSLVADLPTLTRRRPVLLGAAALALVLLLFVILRPSQNRDSATSFHEVRRGDFTVTVVEGGTLSSVREVSIRNQVEGVARIIYIVPEGTYVKKGDLLVELDSSQAKDQLNQQLIGFEKAKFSVEQARAQIEIARSATNSDFLAATLKLELAEIELEKYLKGQRLVNLIEASNKVVQAQAQLAVNLDTYQNSVNLAAKGFETKMKVDADGLSVTNLRNSLIVASNSIWMLETFDFRKDLKRYESDVIQAKQELSRVLSQNLRRMAQYEADLNAQINTLALSEQKLERDKKNLEGTRIEAPQDGLVVYAVSESHFSSESLIEGGATVRNRQELIKLPDLSRMKVTVRVHESHINMIRPGLPAYVVLDSMPDEQFNAVVAKVAPLPDTQARWGNPNLKVYLTEVHITDPLPNVKPGVSAKAEIIITNIADTLSVPIQAVTTFKGNPVVYVANGGKPEPRSVETGMYNTKHIQIAKGLKEGERVLLSPPFDLQEKDLEGAVLAEDEKTKAAKTNVPPRLVLSEDDQDKEERPNGTAPGAEQSQNGALAGEGRGRGGGFNPAEMLKQYDKNADGQLDESEREALKKDMAGRFGRPGGANGALPNPADFLKQFDKDGDGQLSETERTAMRDAFGGGRSGLPSGRGEASEGAPRSPQGERPVRPEGGRGGGGRAP